MSIDLGTDALTLANQERTASVTISTPYNTDPTIQVMREKLSIDQNGNVVASNPVRRLSRQASAIAGESYTLDDGTVITVPQMMEAMKKAFDQWAQA